MERVRALLIIMSLFLVSMQMISCEIEGLDSKEEPVKAYFGVELDNETGRLMLSRRKIYTNTNDKRNEWMWRGYNDGKLRSILVIQILMNQKKIMEAQEKLDEKVQKALSQRGIGACSVSDSESTFQEERPRGFDRKTFKPFRPEP